MLELDVLATEGLARRGRLTLNHGVGHRFSNAISSAPLDRASPLWGGPLGYFGLADRTLSSGRLAA